MTCGEVERFWSLRLDGARAGSVPAGSAEESPALAEHLARCPRCRSRAAAFATLARGIAAMEGPPTAPAGLSDRILAAVRAEEAPGTVPMRRDRGAAASIVRRLSAAAAVLAVVIGGRALWSPGVEEPGPRPIGDTPAIAVHGPPRPLTEAVADVAEVTVAIARRTSEPAARLGRDVLGAASASASASPTGPDPAPGIPREGAADRVVKVIGDGLGAGVRPLSQPTRSAFSFLIPSLSPVEEPAPPGRGA